MKALKQSQFSQLLPLDGADYRVFCDFDGTLVDIANAPHKIYVNEYIPELLMALDNRFNFCLVSGRSLEDLRQYLPIDALNTFGCHGAEFSRKGQQYIPECSLNQILQEIELKLCEVLFNYPGVLVEEKPYSLAIHYRNFVGDIEKLKSFLDDILSAYDNEIQLLSGKKVYEFCLKHINKGQAVSGYLDKISSNNKNTLHERSIFIGDDTTDEAGFKKVNSLGGISIRVGFLKESSAHYYVEDIYAVHAFLHYLSQTEIECLAAS